METIENLRSEVVAARKKAEKAAIAHARAKAEADATPKSQVDEKASKAAKAAKAKAAATAANAEVRKLEAKLDRTERKAEKDAEKAKDALDAASAAQDALSSMPQDLDWVRLGEEFADHASGEVACVDGAWRAYDLGRWEAGISRGHTVALHYARMFYRDMGGEIGIELRRMSNAPETILRYAQIHLTRSADEFNPRRSAHLINVGDGKTLNLKTLELQAPSSGDMLTFRTPIRFNPEADVERIRDGFAKNLGGDLDQLACLARACGYSMTGERNEKAAFFLLGNEKRRGENGDNGKTLFMESARRVLGNAAGGVKPSLIVDSGHKRGANDHDGAMIPLSKVRAAIGAEFGRNDVMDEDTFKRITGGDTIQARGVGAAESIEFICRAKLFFTTNYLPMVVSRDRAMTDRIVPFPFFVRFRKPGEAGDGPVADPKFADWLESEEGQEAMLLWMAQGARDWYQQGLNLPASLIALRDEHLAKHDIWAPFVRDYLIGDADGVVSVSILKGLAEEFLGRPLRNQGEENAFLRDLEGRGADIEHRGGKAYRRGFSLSKTAEDFLIRRGTKLPGQVIRRDQFEIFEAGRPVPVRRVLKGDLMGAWLEFVAAHEADLVAGAEFTTVPGWGKIRRVA